MLSFLTTLAIIHYADSTISSCSSYSGGICEIRCDGSPHCVGETINCFANFDCKVQCRYYVESDRRRLLPNTNRNLLGYACSGSKYGCCDSTINCPANKDCEVDCTDGCSGVIIHAESSTSLYINDCNSDNNGENNCQDMHVYCPQNGRAGTTDTCEIRGDDSSDDLENMHIYTEEGFRDFKLSGSVDTKGTRLYCGKTMTEHSCIMNTNGDGCASGEPTTCENFLIPTAEPTADPSKTPTSTPTSVTSTPSIPPTQFPSKFPTKTPTKTPTRFPSETPTPDPTFNPTFTYNPSKYPTISPTKYPSIPPTTTQPSISPTPRPVRSGNVGDDDDQGEDDDTEISVDEANINAGLNKTKNDRWIIYLIVSLCIVIFIFFCCALYFVIARKRKEEEEYGDEFRKVQSELVYHTIPGLSGDNQGELLTEPAPKPRPKTTMTMTGEHMEYNEVYGDTIAPLEEENENILPSENNEDINQRKLYYKSQFMQMMMADPQQQAYLMTLDEITRRSYIEYQCNLYLSRIEDMARRKTLPIHQTENAPTTDDDDSVDNINNTIVENDHEIINQSSDDENILNEVNTDKGTVTAGGIDINEMDSDESVDDINNNDIINEENDDIVKGIDTQGILPADIEADPFFD